MRFFGTTCRAGAPTVVVAAFAAFAASVAFAGGGTFEVHNVTELTNAFKQTSGNVNTTIKIHPGIYDVGDCAMASGAHVATSSGGIGARFIYGLGADPSETIILGKGRSSNSGRRVSSFDGRCTVSNLTFTGGCLTSGAGGGVAGNGDTLWNCIISNNYASGAGGGTEYLKARNCLFAYNESGSNGGAGRFSAGCWTMDCTFSTNRAYNGGGVSLGTHTRAKFLGNVAHGGGGVHAAAVVDSEFIGNRLYGGGGGAGLGGTYGNSYATNCVFRDNIASNGVDTGWDGEVIKASHLYNCKLYDNNCYSCMIGAGSTLRRCEVRRGTGSRVHVDMVANGTFYNTLFTDCHYNYPGSGSVAGFAKSCTFYNCTVIGFENNMSKFLESCTAVNTIFDSNRALPNMSLQNCLWTNGNPSSYSGGGKVTFEDLDFADPENGDYTLGQNSAARNAGWMDAAYLKKIGDVDLDGNPRINLLDQKKVIDIGCYERAIVPGGFQIFFN